MTYATNGEPLESWTDVFTASVGVRPLKVSEKTTNGQVEQVAHVLIWGRYTPLVQNDYRIILNDQHILMIDGIEDVNFMKARLDITCYEVDGIVGLLYDQLSEDAFNALSEDEYNAMA